MDQFCFTKPYMSIIKSKQDQHETPQQTTCFQKVERSPPPKYQPSYRSIYDDYAKLGYTSFLKSLVFPSQSKENCVSTDTWECYKQGNVTVARCLGMDNPTIIYTTGGTKPCCGVSASAGLSCSYDWCLTLRYHMGKLCFMELAGIYPRLEVCSAHVNLIA